MAKKTRTAKVVAKAPAAAAQPHEVNPGVAAASTWHVHRAGMLPLAIHADELDITDSGALIFIVSKVNTAPHVVVASNQYLYCSKIR